MEAKPGTLDGQRQCQKPLRNQKKEFKNQFWLCNRADVKIANVMNMLWPTLTTHATVLWGEKVRFCHSIATIGSERQHLLSRELGPQNREKAWI